MHKNNLHIGEYDFPKLCKAYPPLKEFVFINKHNIQTVDFGLPKVVKAVNTALLMAYYNIKYWQFSDSNLCPPIPNRSDYIHYLTDLLNSDSITKNIKILDIGVGASCIYPILGNAINNWKFVGVDVDNNSITNAQKIIDENDLKEEIKLRYQPNKEHILQGIINQDDYFDACMCNPPFYRSQLDASGANSRKLKGLGIKNQSRNFSGNSNELWYKGGEKAFLHNYLFQSSKYKNQCYWFTSLVSKKDNVKSMYDSLNKMNATEIKTIEMNQGNKISRIVTWTFLTSKERENWALKSLK